MKVNNVLKIKKEHEEKEFIREVVIYLAKEESTPTDILETSFSDVSVEEKEYLLVSGHASVEYTCSVGYDREEIYYVKEKKRDYVNGRDYYEDVKKTRTVTDWRPHSGRNTSKEFTIVGNASTQEGYRSESEIATCYQTCEKTSKQEVGVEPEINEEAFALAKRVCVASCFYVVKLPGDRQKDCDYSGELEVEEVGALIVPEYTLTYDYQGMKQKAKGFAAGDMQINVDYPNISADVSKEAKKSVKAFKILAVLSLIVGVVLNVLMNWIGWWCVVGYVAAIVFLVVYIKKGNAKMKSIYAFRQEEKKKNLIAFLQKNEMQPLTEIELASFDKK
ncbi:MAG: DUF3784 domain-containing protein [Clostridia bacterium]|nr:DUF3784 domain-containing protein [Clostridia bacterium]